MMWLQQQFGPLWPLVWTMAKIVAIVVPAMATRL